MIITHMSEPATDAIGTIVVVDDNHVNAALIGYLVAKHGYAVETVGSGHEAVLRVAAGGVDGMFLDLHMPDMDGFDTARAIRASEVNSAVRMPIIAVTADLNLDLHARALAAGMDDLMRKPVSVASIASILERRLPRGPKPASVRESSGCLPICLPAFDPTSLQQAEASAPGSAGRILGTFLADLARILDILPGLVDRRAFLDAQRSVHPVRSGADRIGTPQLAQVLDDLESGLRAGDHLRCRRSLRALRAARDQLHSAVGQESLAWLLPGLSAAP